MVVVVVHVVLISFGIDALAIEDRDRESDFDTAHLASGPSIQYMYIDAYLPVR